ncbi:MAG TPA: antibiotic biosynthesis monooxygenase [Firmicutes bacterium]|nr:antibiotic biosynthesis monooxygenase [Bacillota bacterium]
MYKNQPGVVLRMHAKPGMGDALFELTTNLHYTGDPDGPVDWVLCRPNDDPDTLWAFEFYRDEESFTRHYSNPAIDKVHDKVIDLLADIPLRADVHIVVSSSASGT